MKRKFILLPIALTTLTPMVSMVGCNNQNKIVLDQLFILSSTKNNGMIVGLQSEKTYDIHINEKYSVFVNLNKMVDYFHRTIDEWYTKRFRFVTTSSVSGLKDWEVAKKLQMDKDKTNASSSGDPLQLVESPDDVVAGKYSISCTDDNNWFMYFGDGNFSKDNPIFEINVSFAEPADNQMFYFFCS